MLRKSTRGVLIFWLILSFALVCACGGGGGGGSDSSSPPPSSTPAPPENVSDKGIVMGKVVDEFGAQVGAVSVSLDGQAVTTNEQGFFVIEKVLPGVEKVLKINKSGYMTGTSTVNVVAGQETFTNLSLKKIGQTQQATGGASTTVTDTRADGKNGSVIIPANSVVNGVGQPVASYTVEITTLLPSDPNFTSLFPGRFLGGGTPGSTANPQPLRSYGMVNVDLK